MVYEEGELVEKAFSSSTKYKNKEAVIFVELQISRSVIAPVIDPGGKH